LPDTYVVTELGLDDDREDHSAIPTWLSIELAILAVSVIIIAAGVWIGFEGPPLPLLLSTGPS
jgi:hypothetical protein